MKKLIVFDLDGTLAESKWSIDPEMTALLHDLLGIVKVAVISGGDWLQFEKQLLSNLPHDNSLENLSLLPTCGTKFYKYIGDWEKIYSEDFTGEEKKKINDSLKKVIGEVGFKVEKVWGEVIEDRGSQITFSALGQHAPLDENATEVYIFHNKPKSGAGHEPVIQHLLPLDEKWRQSLTELKWPTKLISQVIGGIKPTLLALIHVYLFATLFKACAESLASENASRLVAMQRAEKNIDELLDDLTHKFHGLRQSSIDEELFDVVSGYEMLSKIHT